MRVAVVSDIHGNRRALQAVLADLKLTAPDIVVHGGDLAFGGAHPAEIIDQIRALGWPGVYGNADELLWSQQRLNEMSAASAQFAPVAEALLKMVPATVGMLGDERLGWLQTLPIVHRSNAFTLVHASPTDVWRSPQANATDEELQQVYRPLRAQTVVYGHIHVPFIRRTNELAVINAGSVSQSYDGDLRASYLLLTSGDAEIRRVAYDVEAEARDLIESNLPHASWLSQILLAGKYCPLQ